MVVIAVALPREVGRRTAFVGRESLRPMSSVHLGFDRTAPDALGARPVSPPCPAGRGSYSAAYFSGVVPEQVRGGGGEMKRSVTNFPRWRA